MSLRLNRRRILAAAGLSAAAVFQVTTRAAARPSVLIAERISVAAIQTISPSSSVRGLAAMDYAVARSQATAPKHLVTFAQRFFGNIAVSVDGPELARAADIAARHKVYLSFGALIENRRSTGKDDSVALLIGPDGAIIAFDRLAAMQTGARVYDTAIGKVAHGYAEGAELIILTDPPPRPARCFSIFTTTAAGDRTSGTAIIGPDGDVRAEAGSAWWQVVAATLPIGELRERRLQQRIV